MPKRLSPVPYFYAATLYPVLTLQPYDDSYARAPGGKSAKGGGVAYFVLSCRKV